MGICVFKNGRIIQGYRSLFVILGEDGEPLKPKWQYIGDLEDITPCPWQGEEGAGCDACIDKSCPGEIAGRCMFSDDDPLPEYEHLFKRLHE